MSISHILTDNNYTIHANQIYVGTGGSPITEYIETDELTTTLTGGFKDPQQLTYKVTKLNNVVSIHLNQVRGESGSSGAKMSTQVNALSLEFRPSADVYTPLSVYGTGANETGTAKIVAADGSIVFCIGANSSFGTSSDNGLQKGTITYMI
jgi:hypothetical protein